MAMWKHYQEKYPLRGSETSQEQNERLKHGLNAIRDKTLGKKALALIANYWAYDEPKPPIPFTLMATLYYRERNLPHRVSMDNRYFKELLYLLPDILNHVLGADLLRAYARGDDPRLDDDVIERMILVFYSEKEKLALKYFFKNIIEADFDLSNIGSKNLADRPTANAESS